MWAHEVALAGTTSRGRVPAGLGVVVVRGRVRAQPLTVGVRPAVEEAHGA